MQLETRDRKKERGENEMGGQLKVLPDQLGLPWCCGKERMSEWKRDGEGGGEGGG